MTIPYLSQRFTRLVDNIIRRFPPLPSSWEVHKALLDWHKLPKLQVHYQRVCHTIPSRHKRFLHGFDALNPPLSSSEPSRSWTWEPHRDGDFFSVHMPGEPLIQYRSGGYHPVHIGGTLRGGRYTILGKLGWGRDATIWLAKDSR